MALRELKPSYSPRYFLVPPPRQAVLMLEPGTYILELTPLDQIMPRTYSRFILCFRSRSSNPSCVIDALQRGIDTTIGRVPYLGGTVGLGDNGAINGRLRVQYQIPAKTVKLQLRNLTSLNYDELSDAGMPMSVLDERFCPVSPIPGLESPAFAAQATFIDGGHMLCLCIHHAVMDGTAMGTLVEYLAYNTRQETATITGCNFPNVVSRMDQFKEHCPPGRQAEHPEYKIVHESTVISPPVQTLSQAPPEPIVRIFTFSKQKLGQLKASIMRELPSLLYSTPLDDKDRWISTNDTLVSLLWSCITRARSVHLDTRISRFGMAVNGRDHLKLPATYLGNVNLYAYSQIEIERDISRFYRQDGDRRIRWLAYDAIVVREAVRKVDTEHIQSAVSFCNSLPDIRTLQASFRTEADVAVTSWAKWPTVDCGQVVGGSPEFIRLPKSKFDGLCIILPHTKPLNGDLEVIVGLRGDDMDRLVQDPTFSTCWQTRFIE